jgi:glycosyltransferase involved in cell wall biosynthesis
VLPVRATSSENRLRVCHTSILSVAAPVFGGGQVYADRLAAGLAGRGHAVRMVCTGTPPRPGERGTSYPTTFVHHFRRHQLNALSVAFWLVPRLSAFDVVHCHGAEGALVAAWPGRGVPIVYSEHFGELPDFQRPSPLTIRSRADAQQVWRRQFFRPTRYVARRAERVVATSHFVASAAVAAYGLDPARVVVVPPGIDRFASPPAGGEAAVGEPVSIGYVGRLDGFKGLDTLLHAYARVARDQRGTRLVLIGDGPSAGHVRELVETLGLTSRVDLAGQLTRAETGARMRQLDMLVLPSRVEALGMVILEAMALGVAVVASRVGGIPEIVEHGRNGLLVPVGDADQLASALLSLVQDPARRRQLARAGYEWIRADERFRWESAAAQHERVYGAAIESFGRSTADPAGRS